MEKKIKLSDAQKNVIMLMREGWEVAQSYGLNSRAWMQKGKIGHGGRSKELNFITVRCLLDKGIITNNGTSKRLSDVYYSLTESGKTINID